MTRKRAYGLERAKRCLIEAEGSKKSICSEQFKRDVSKSVAAENVISRCAVEGVFYKDPEWDWKEDRWTYFIEGYWWMMSFTLTDDDTVILKSIRQSTFNPSFAPPPLSDPRCPYTADEAIQLLRLAQAASKVTYTNHCLERLWERSLCDDEVQECIATGLPYKGPEWNADINGWTYSMAGGDLRLFFSVGCGEATLITLYVPDPNYRRAQDAGRPCKA
ncbi:MAG TPA: DUF4258 domain-containing protein [Acidobacteriaceae bacterium]